MSLIVQDLSKKFCRSLRRSLAYGVKDVVAELGGFSRRSDVLREGEFWALSGVGFELAPGESLGLVGVNGAGKTTLLRLVSGLIKPDGGEIRIRGKVAPLIALGAGFSPVLTGRENVGVNMAILGLRKPEIEARFADVLEFAEIGDAIDAPLQTYSSGMAARLGFACAIHTDPDLLLIDEVLAVGDLRFRNKCYRRLADMRKQGTAFVIVSHNPQVILGTCDRALYLAGGRVAMIGDPESVMARYEEDLNRMPVDGGDTSWSRSSGQRKDSTGLEITDVFLTDEKGGRLPYWVSGTPVSLSIRCRATNRLSGVGVSVTIRERLGESETVLSQGTGHETLEVAAGDSEIRMHWPSCGLKAGTYVLKLAVGRGPFENLDAVEGFVFTVKASPGGFQGAFYQPRSWEVVTLSGA